MGEVANLAEISGEHSSGRRPRMVQESGADCKTIRLPDISHIISSGRLILCAAAVSSGTLLPSVHV